MEQEVKTNAAEVVQQPEEVKEQPTVVAPEEGAAEEAPVAEPKPRDLFYERIRTNFPEGKYEDDEEEYYRNALSGMDALEKDSKSYKDLTAKLTERLNQDPEEAEVFLDWLEGTDLWTATARHKGADALMPPQEGTPEYDSWKQAGDERRKELDDTKAKLDEYRANADASAADFEELAASKGWTPEEKEEVQNYITSILEKVYSGRLDPEFYDFVLKGRNYDSDIEGAREQGRVDGRNEKIEVEKKHLAGSGLPNGGAGGDASEEVDETPVNKTVDWLAKMGKRRV